MELKFNNIIGGKNIIDDKVFTDVILPYCYGIKSEEAVLDFSNVDRVNINVLVQLLALGYSVRKYGIQIKIILKYATELTDYLYHSKFIYTARYNNIITFNDPFNEGTASEDDNRGASKIIQFYSSEKLIERYSKKYIFNDISESDKLYRCLYDEIFRSDFLMEYDLIQNDIYRTNRVIKALDFRQKDYTQYLKILSNITQTYDYKLKTDIINFDKLKTYGEIIIEILHNALYHGNNIGIIGLQAYTTKNKEQILEISISDCGLGFYKTLYKKIKETYSISVKDFKNYNNKKDRLSQISRDYFSIYEAILFRKNLGLRGIYDICKDIAYCNKGSYIKFKNNNIVLELSKDYIFQHLIVKDDSTTELRQNEELRKNVEDFINIIKEDNRRRKERNLKQIAQVLDYNLPGVNIYIFVK